MANSGFIIAIDGPAGAGKSTVSKMVAKKLGYLYIDTGAMYRSVAWLAMENGIDVKDVDNMVRLAAESNIELKQSPIEDKLLVFINGNDVTIPIRSPQITQLTSLVAAIGGVRHHLVSKQQEMAKKDSVVMDGRDIGTVVLPDADLKIFLTASAEERAQRRLKELQAAKVNANFNELIEQIKQRDNQDSTRKADPLKQAIDAVVVNTDNMTLDQVVEHILSLQHNTIASNRK